MLKYIILGFLAYQPKSGYQLKQVMETSTNHFWRAELSQIYTTLKQLQADGLVVSEIEAQETRPDSRIYSITEAGRADLQVWLNQPNTGLRAFKDVFLAKLFFSARLEKTTLLTQLHLQRNLCQQQLAYYHEHTAAYVQQMVESKPQLRQDGLLWTAIERFGELSMEMYLRWLDETIEMVEKNFQ